MKNTPVWLSVICATNMNLKTQIKKGISCAAIRVQTSIISQSQEKFTLTSVLNKNSNNDNRGLYIGLK